MEKKQTVFLIIVVVVLAVVGYFYYSLDNIQASPGELTRSITPTEIQCTDQDGDNTFIDSYVLVGSDEGLPSQIHDSCDANGKINEQICEGNEPSSFTEPCSDGFACQESACRGVPEWTQTDFLTASDSAENDYFGGSVAVSGDVMVVGAYYDDDLGSNSGSAYVFRDDGNQWVQEQKLTAYDGDVSDMFGASVAIAEDMIAIGAYGDDDMGGSSGSVYIFRYDGNQEQWVFKQKLTAFDGATGSNFGKSIGLSNDALVIAAHLDDAPGEGFGSAYVFRYDGNQEQWVFKQKLTASDGAANDFFGSSVSISGDVIAIGAWRDDDGLGSAYVFRYVGDQWEEDQKLSASDGAAGDYFGESLSTDGDTIVVGAWRSKSYDGSAYVFRYENNQWIEKQMLTVSTPSDTRFSYSIAVFENMLVVGATNPYYGDKIGKAHVFKYDFSVSAWVEEVVLQGDPSSQVNNFGGSVGTDGDSIVVGAYSDSGSVPEAGSAFVFQKRCNFISDLDGDGDVDEDDADIFMEQFGATCGE
ncbi:MAG: FG-GAP repeat protein [Nanoarchaeota archaeon]|nr:FG-GAP repeat protein [Nanoarchaeota archaeon]MBU1104246.1 FG-GAP repeat protein [Nanoarchaeota archaeon]